MVKSVQKKLLIIGICLVGFFIVIDSEISTTWEDLKISADPYLQDLFEFFWKN